MAIGKFSETLKCVWWKIEPVEPDGVLIHLGKNSCTDMAGAIRVAQAIMPQVRFVTTYSGMVADTLYAKDEKGEWKAFDTRPTGIENSKYRNELQAMQKDGVDLWNLNMAQKMAFLTARKKTPPLNG